MKAATLILSSNACIHINALFTIAHSGVFTFVIEVNIKKMFSGSLSDDIYLMTPKLNMKYFFMYFMTKLVYSL